VGDSTLDAIPGLFEKPDYGHHLGWEVYHVHFHSIEVARFLFARWRGWARLDSCKQRDAARPISLVTLQVVGPNRWIAVLVDNCCACFVFYWLISVGFVLHFLLFYV